MSCWRYTLAVSVLVTALLIAADQYLPTRNYLPRNPDAPKIDASELATPITEMQAKIEKLVSEHPEVECGYLPLESNIKKITLVLGPITPEIMATLETEKDKVIVSLHSELQPDVKDPRAIAVQMHPATCPGYYTHDEFVKQFDMRITSKADYIEILQSVGSYIDKMSTVEFKVPLEGEELAAVSTFLEKHGLKASQGTTNFSRS